MFPFDGKYRRLTIGEVHRNCGRMRASYRLASALCFFRVTLARNTRLKTNLVSIFAGWLDFAGMREFM